MPFVRLLFHADFVTLIPIGKIVPFRKEDDYEKQNDHNCRFHDVHSHVHELPVLVAVIGRCKYAEACICVV